MSGLMSGAAGGEADAPHEKIERAHAAWQKAMVRRIDEMRTGLRERNLPQLAHLAGARIEGERLSLNYWLDMVVIHWPEIKAFFPEKGEALPTFDQAMIMYYLETADGANMADRWIGFRELPDGAFYHQAFESYSGRLVAERFGDAPEQLEQAARKLRGTHLTQLAPQAYAFQPLPRLRLAIAVWPGDEDFRPRASVLFDAAASHYMTTDGLALLGSGLARRLIRAA